MPHPFSQIPIYFNYPQFSLLITDALNASYQQPKRRQRDEQLMTNILSTLRGNGNVLVCVDTAGRHAQIKNLSK